MLKRLNKTNTTVKCQQGTIKFLNMKILTINFRANGLKLGKESSKKLLLKLIRKLRRDRSRLRIVRKPCCSSKLMKRPDSKLSRK